MRLYLLSGNLAHASIFSKQKEESAKLLCLLIGAAASLVKSYAPTILNILLRIAAAPQTSVPIAAHCIICIGKLAQVAGEELVPSASSILTLVVEMLNGQTSNLKRDAALRTLGQLVSNSGEAISPYTDHPRLLGILFRFLRTETSQVIRLETIRTMGMLGALDPSKHKVSSVISSDVSYAHGCPSCFRAVSTTQIPKHPVRV